MKTPSVIVSVKLEFEYLGGTEQHPEAYLMLHGSTVKAELDLATDFNQKPLVPVELDVLL